MYHNPDFPPGGARRARRVRKLLALFERDEIEAGVDALLAYLDAKAGDPDLEPEDDRCAAGDDHMIAGPAYQRRMWERDTWAIGSDDDAEYGHLGAPKPTYGVDQRRPREATLNTPAAMFT